MSGIPQPSRLYPEAITALLSRRLADGGFAETGGGEYRADATAWAALCLAACRLHAEVVADALAKLSAAQLPDGCIPLTTDYPQAVWTTAAASMALRGARQCAAAHARTVGFLLALTGRQLPKPADSPLGHDTTLPGWPWIADTHSWVEPTAMAIRALIQAGHRAHPRVQSGITLLLDRQLPEGGWNYGNTTVYGKTLNAIPAATGTALWALAGLCAADRVVPSLNLLTRQLPKLHTPLSLGWALLGLDAWGTAVPDAHRLVADCLQRQARFGPYGTSHLAVLLTAVNTGQSGGGLP